MSLKSLFQQMALNIAGHCRSSKTAFVEMSPNYTGGGARLVVELSKFSTAYKSTPHATTGTSPYFMMFGQEIRTKLLDL